VTDPAPPVVRLRDVLALRSAQVSLALATLVALGLCAVPLLGIHGAESALVLGVVLPPLAALCAARRVRDARGRNAGTTPLELIATALATAGLLWLAPVVVLALDALRIRNCAPLEGVAFMVLGPGAGVTLGALWGLFAATACRGSRAGTALALAGPLGGMARAFVEFYTGPGIYFFGHYFGYFPGTIYDEQLSLPGTLWVLRALTGVAGLALCALFAGNLDGSLRLRLRPVARAGARLWIGVALVGASLFALGEVYAPELGLRASEAHIREALGREHASARCRLVVPRELHVDELGRLAADCDFRVALLERRLGIAEPTPITVFLFRSADERRALMGAHGTNLAKPWLHHVYLEHGGWPHPVLHHELAHVILGHVGRGPFRIAGALGGLWPDPARIEGAAVAAAHDVRNGLTSHQWCRAMLELGLLPSLDSLLGAGFLGTQKRMAYTVTGSVLGYLFETEGAARVRTSYAAPSFAAGLGRPLAGLERDWHTFLRGQPLSELAVSQVRLYFDGGSVFSQVCPHRVAALRGELGGALAAGDDARAEQGCRDVLEVDPADTGTRARLVGVLARRGRADKADAELAALRGPPPAAPALLLAVRAELADEAWRAGRFEEAATSYAALLAEPQTDDALRLLTVKHLGVRADAIERQALFDLLIGPPGRKAEGALAMYLIRELAARRSDGLAAYLEGRQLHYAERHIAAAEALRLARERGLPGPAFEREATRIEAISRFVAGQRDAATRLFARLATDPEPARRLDAEDWLARIRFEAARAAR